MASNCPQVTVLPLIFTTTTNMTNRMTKIFTFRCCLTFLESEKSQEQVECEKYDKTLIKQCQPNIVCGTKLCCELIPIVVGPRIPCMGGLPACFPWRDVRHFHNPPRIPPPPPSLPTVLATIPESTNRTAPQHHEQHSMPYMEAASIPLLFPIHCFAHNPSPCSTHATTGL